MSNLKRRRLASALLAVSIGLTCAGAATAQEAKVYSVTTWNAGCGGSQRDAWDDMADAWYDEITDTGFSIFGHCLFGHCGDAYSRDGRLANGQIVNSKFADASKVAFGADSSHLDEARSEP